MGPHYAKVDKIWFLPLLKILCHHRQKTQIYRSRSTNQTAVLLRHILNRSVMKTMCLFMLSMLISLQSFAQQRWTQGRTVTCLKTNSLMLRSKFQVLLVTSAFVQILKRVHYFDNRLFAWSKNSFHVVQKGRSYICKEGMDRNRTIFSGDDVDIIIISKNRSFPEGVQASIFWQSQLLRWLKENCILGCNSALRKLFTKHELQKTNP